MDAVSLVRYHTGNSIIGNLANALQVARTQQFVSNRGDRIGAPNIIVVLFNGGVAIDSPAVSLQLCLDILVLFYDFYLIFSGRELTFTFAICDRRSVCLSVVCRL